MFERNGYGYNGPDTKDASDLFPKKPEYITREELEKGLAAGKLAAERGEIRTYYVASGAAPHSLALDVNDRLKQGFRLWGSVSSDKGQLYQAMVR